MKKVVLFHKKHFQNREGSSSLEFLLNLLIYLPIFLLLFQISLIPLQQFYLTQAARSGALVYIQIKHFNGYPDVNTITKKMIPEDSEMGKSASQDVIKFIKTQFSKSAKDNALPGKIFNPDKIEVEIHDTGTVQSGGNVLVNIAKEIGKTIADFFFTEEVKVTVRYPFTLFKIFDFSFGTFNIQGTYTIRYNP